MKIKESPEDFKVFELPGFSLVPHGSYSIYLLRKEERNTEGVVQEIARQLRIPRKNIGYAGSKDRNAVTEQYISIHGRPNILKLELDNASLEYGGTAEVPITLGSHIGNRFEIIARDCEKKPRKINKFINYFGEQRFSENNEGIGKALVKKEFRKACGLIDSPVVLEHLQDNVNDFLGALKRLPLKTITLYVHAYQSFLWNKVADKFKDESQMLIPILGFATDFKNERVQDAYEMLMQEEAITKEDFISRQWPEITSEGGERWLYAEIEWLGIEKIGRKDYLLKFSLPTGSYATVAVNQIFSG